MFRGGCILSEHNLEDCATRLEIIGEQFICLFQAAGLDDQQRNSLHDALDAKEICAFGICLTQQNEDTQRIGRIYEVELQVDWELHKTMTKRRGKYARTSPLQFEDTGEHMVISENTREMNRLTKGFQREMSCWLRLSPNVDSDASHRRSVFRRLSLSGDSPPDWETEPVCAEFGFSGIEEVIICLRRVPDHDP